MLAWRRTITCTVARRITSGCGSPGIPALHLERSDRVRAQTFRSNGCKEAAGYPVAEAGVPGVASEAGLAAEADPSQQNSGKHLSTSSGIARSTSGSSTNSFFLLK